MRPFIRTQKITATTATEAKAWAKHLNCSVAELRIALRAVGSSTERVQGYLGDLRGQRVPAAAPGKLIAAHSGNAGDSISVVHDNASAGRNSTQ